MEQGWLASRLSEGHSIESIAREAGRPPSTVAYCLKCRSEAVVARRRRVKVRLVMEAGGRCVLCGYDRSPAALQFHHRDPEQKAFSIAYRGVARSLAAAREEMRKCVLLCATCHAEVEAGVATLPPSRTDYGPG
jgi:hypothetical protein